MNARAPRGRWIFTVVPGVVWLLVVLAVGAMVKTLLSHQSAPHRGVVVFLGVILAAAFTTVAARYTRRLMSPRD